MSRVRRIVIAATLLLALAVPATPVMAATAAECTAQIAQLQSDVASASFVNAKDQAQTDAKLAAAAAKLEDGKNADAVAKLVDARTKTEALLAAGKVDAEDGAALITDLDAAIACIESIPAAA